MELLWSPEGLCGRGNWTGDVSSPPWEKDGRAAGAGPLSATRHTGRGRLWARRSCSSCSLGRRMSFLGLQFQKLALKRSSAMWMAIECTAWRPKIEYPRIRFVRFTGPALTEGVAHYRNEAVDLPILNPARMMVDCFRYRGKVGLDVAVGGCAK